MRQWVLTLPSALRYRLACDSSLVSTVLQMFVRAVCASIRRRAGIPGLKREARCGAVSFVQRFGDALNLNVHFADFGWVPNAHPIGSTVETEDGHWITFTPGKNERRNHPPIPLAEGQYFLLGDNRDESFDSREFGPVPKDFFLGKAIAVPPMGDRIR